jgi:hypothetical protein
VKDHVRALYKARYGNAVRCAGAYGLPIDGQGGTVVVWGRIGPGRNATAEIAALLAAFKLCSKTAICALSEDVRTIWPRSASVEVQPS